MPSSTAPEEVIKYNGNIRVWDEYAQLAIQVLGRSMPLDSLPAAAAGLADEMMRLRNDRRTDAPR